MRVKFDEKGPRDGAVVTMTMNVDEAALVSSALEVASNMAALGKQLVLAAELTALSLVIDTEMMSDE